MEWDDVIDNSEENQLRLKQIIKGNPNDAEAHYELASIYANIHEYAVAIEYCEKAIHLDPKKVAYRALCSFANTNIEEHEQAIEYLVDIIELEADESNRDVDMAQDAQRGMDKEYAVLKVVDLRKEGKDRIADKLEVLSTFFLSCISSNALCSP